ncbi:ribbon-helix-helix protein, CopG family [Streptomyces sp. NPDC058766]|uniref:ribbon-helix-helix protein, CopG family n=1 Tax=Streptomyces sp. NPDC058766 TaxID=3346630 RepID=UPI00369858FD
MRHTAPNGATTLVVTPTSVLSLHMDHDLLERVRHHAARGRTSVQDPVVRTLIRDDFDQRFRTAVQETERFHGPSGSEDGDQVRPSAGIR